MTKYTENPFSIIFGKEPAVAVERTQIMAELTSDFSAQRPSQQVVLLTGVRGSGKSALTAQIMKSFTEKKDWIVTDLLVEGDMLRDLLNRLTQSRRAKAVLSDAKIAVSAFGISAEIEPNKKRDPGIQLDEILESLTRHEKRVLIVVDDVAPTPGMKTFAHYFHSCLMKDYNVFLVMNGVYDNIENLQNQKTLTFLQRAPKIELPPLNKQAVAQLYSEVFPFSDDCIQKLAGLTNGFAYAVQALGYLVWRNKSAEPSDCVDWKRVLPLYDNMLADGVYNKLWYDLSEKNKELLSTLAGNDKNTTASAELLTQCGWAKAQLSSYKKELVRKGILVNQRGYFTFALPRFREYINSQLNFL